MLHCESRERVDETGTERKSSRGHEEETQRAPERAARHRSGPRETEVQLNDAVTRSRTSALQEPEKHQVFPVGQQGSHSAHTQLL